MVEDERDCIEIITQLSAVSSSMQSVAALVLQNYATICVEEDEPAKLGEKIANAVSMWLK